MHPFERKLSSLSNGVFGKVVQRTDRELFDLKARGDIFLKITLYIYSTYIVHILYTYLYVCTMTMNVCIYIHMCHLQTR